MATREPDTHARVVEPSRAASPQAGSHQSTLGLPWFHGKEDDIFAQYGKAPVKILAQRFGAPSNAALISKALSLGCKDRYRKSYNYVARKSHWGKP